MTGEQASRSLIITKLAYPAEDGLHIENSKNLRLELLVHILVLRDSYMIGVHDLIIGECRPFHHYTSLHFPPSFYHYPQQPVNCDNRKNGGPILPLLL